MDDRPGQPGLVALPGRVLRWKASSYWQIWLMVAVGYLSCATAFWLIGDWSRHGAVSFAILAAPWLGFAGGQIYDLRRRRNGYGRVSEAKPLGRVPRS